MTPIHYFFHDYRTNSSFSASISVYQWFLNSQEHQSPGGFVKTHTPRAPDEAENSTGLLCIESDQPPFSSCFALFSSWVLFSGILLLWGIQSHHGIYYCFINVVLEVALLLQFRPSAIAWWCRPTEFLNLKAETRENLTGISWCF